MNAFVGPLPRHLYVCVDSAFVFREPVGFIPAVWFGLVSFPSRMWGCTVMLENGAIYRNLPPHSIAFSDDPDPGTLWTPRESQHWDCYGWDWTALEYPYLRGLDCKARVRTPQVRSGTGRDLEIEGEYLFTVAPVGDAFSTEPEQAKEFTFIKLDNGRLTIQPTDRVVFRELSFTGTELAFPSGIRRQTEVWRAE